MSRGCSEDRTQARSRPRPWSGRGPGLADRMITAEGFARLWLDQLAPSIAYMALEVKMGNEPSGDATPSGELAAGWESLGSRAALIPAKGRATPSSKVAGLRAALSSTKSAVISAASVCVCLGLLSAAVGCVSA